MLVAHRIDVQPIRMRKRQGAMALCALAVALVACGDSQSSAASRGADGATDSGAEDTPALDAGDVQTADDDPVDPLDGSDGETPDTGDDAATTPLRVLFVGNSYTGANDLPAVVQAIGEATPGGSVEVESVLRGGARLYDHWTTTGARELVETGDFGAVVLQGQSLEPITRGREFDVYAELFSDAMFDAGARAVWFATWARREGDPFYDTGLGGTPESMTSWLEGRYQYVAHWHDGFVARVGAAWQLALAELPDVGLHADDGSHPSDAGTLLSACVLVQGLTGQTPRLPDPPPLGVPRETATALCALAPRVACWTNELFCDASCIQPLTDWMHCGDCGVACPGEDPCVSGVCGCPEGQIGCSRRCVDLSTDSRNCGACGIGCGDGGRYCEDGSCICPAAARRSIDYATLSALRPGCTGFDSPLLECNAAVHEHCARQECFNTGFGPSPAPGFGFSVMCGSEDIRTTSYTELSSLMPACDGTTERAGSSCSTAIHRYCVSAGAASGFGPVDSAGDEVTLVCLPHDRTTIAQTTFDLLTARWPSCDPTVEGWEPHCNMASWIWCSSIGHGSGFGPVEALDGDIDVICVDP